MFDGHFYWIDIEFANKNNRNFQNIFFLSVASKDFQTKGVLKLEGISRNFVAVRISRF